MPAGLTLPFAPAVATIAYVGGSNSQPLARSVPLWIHGMKSAS